MPGHIFDANTLRNFALIGQLPLLPQICPGPLYRSGIVRAELGRGPAGFERDHRLDLLQGDTARIQQLARFQGLDAALRGLNVVELALTGTTAHAEAFDFFTYCVDEEWMDRGEAESLALAALKDLTFYTDDFQAKEAVLEYNSGAFGFPPYGQTVALHRPIDVHSSAWLLQTAVGRGLLSSTEAEAWFLDMRTFWGRHPRQTLSALQAGTPGRWW